jgi:hypothetical protein
METPNHSEVTAVKAHPLRDVYLTELRHCIRGLSLADVLSELAHHATVKSISHGGSSGEAWKHAAEDLGNVAADYADKGL